MAKLSKRNYTFLNLYSYYIPSVADLFIILAWFIVGVVFANIITLAFNLFSPEMREVSLIVAYPLMFLPAMIYANYKSQKNSMDKRGVKLDSNNFGKGGAAVALLTVAVGTLTLGFFADYFTTILPEIPEWLEEMLKSMTQGTLWINFVCVSIFAPIFEEWLCRGMVLRGLLHNGSKPVWAIVISAVFFAVIHANPWQAIPAFLLGCFFGLVYYKTGSLKLTMFMHFFNNTFALVLSHLDATKDLENWKDFLGVPAYWIYLAASAALAAVAVIYFLKMPDKTEKGGMDDIPCLFEQ